MDRFTVMWKIRKRIRAESNYPAYNPISISYSCELLSPAVSWCHSPAPITAVQTGWRVDTVAVVRVRDHNRFCCNSSLIKVNDPQSALHAPDKSEVKGIKTDVCFSANTKIALICMLTSDHSHFAWITFFSSSEVVSFLWENQTLQHARRTVGQALIYPVS